jgi:cyclophilin family peptidyl-prolyl cis-trans isomerase
MLTGVSRSAAALLASLALALAAPACGGGDEPPEPEETVAAVDGNGCTPAAQPAPKPEKATEPRGELDPDKTYVATVETNCGTFEITLDAERAPKTGASFKSLADQRFYDETTIHRLVYGFVIQGGDPLGNGDGGPGYTVVEPPPDDLDYEKGVVAMAKTPDEPSGSSGSQFFVVSGQDARELPPEYALLGRVTGGQQVIDKLGAIITDPRTERPEDPIVIQSIRVSER